MARRNVTAAALAPESLSVPDDERQRFRIYSLRPCPECKGSGKVMAGDRVSFPITRCPECRGEGKTLVFITQHDDVLGAGLALITLAVDGEFLDDCPPGLLDREAEEPWLINPWKSSARTVSAAARELALARKTGGSHGS